MRYEHRGPLVNRGLPLHTHFRQQGAHYNGMQHGGKFTGPHLKSRGKKAHNAKAAVERVCAPPLHPPALHLCTPQG